MRPHPIVLLAVLFVPLLVRCQGAEPNGSEVANGPIPTIKASVPLAKLIDSLRIDVRSIRFHVDKSERRFDVFDGDHLLKSYPCVLGEKPVGDKFHQGDRKTPEGTFTFRSKRVHHQWHKFVWVDYPNTESWRRYNERRSEGLIPAGKDIGGEIGIHGVPDGMDHWIDAGEDWTWGCIALKNADVDEIYPYIIAQRTEITVEP
ncbi:MAG: L,D-transpeptidase family protein [Flavobacteriales bacterium]|nr:L,D-transpeptidase family protein [Flavobacteriales bacterium]